MAQEIGIGLKAKYSFYSSLIFFLIANPETYKFTQSIFGGWLGTTAERDGTPTSFGFFFHTFLFFLTVLAFMMFPKD